MWVGAKKSKPVNPTRTIFFSAGWCNIGGQAFDLETRQMLLTGAKNIPGMLQGLDGAIHETLGSLPGLDGAIHERSGSLQGIAGILLSLGSSGLLHLCLGLLHLFPGLPHLFPGLTHPGFGSIVRCGRRPTICPGVGAGGGAGGGGGVGDGMGDGIGGGAEGRAEGGGAGGGAEGGADEGGGQHSVCVCARRARVLCESKQVVKM